MGSCKGSKGRLSQYFTVLRITKFKIFSNENSMAYNAKYRTDVRCLQMGYLDDLVMKWGVMRFHSSAEEEFRDLEWPGTTHHWVVSSLEIDSTQTQMTNIAIHHSHFDIAGSMFKGNICL